MVTQLSVRTVVIKQLSHSVRVKAVKTGYSTVKPIGQSGRSKLWLLNNEASRLESRQSKLVTPQLSQSVKAVKTGYSAIKPDGKLMVWLNC